LVPEVSDEAGTSDRWGGALVRCGFSAVFGFYRFTSRSAMAEPAELADFKVLSGKKLVARGSFDPFVLPATLEPAPQGS
jgi:hypothetical protein